MSADGGEEKTASLRQERHAPDAIYDRYRTYIQHEDNLVNNRIKFTSKGKVMLEGKLIKKTKKPRNSRLFCVLYNRVTDKATLSSLVFIQPVMTSISSTTSTSLLSRSMTLLSRISTEIPAANRSAASPEKSESMIRLISSPSSCWA